MAFKMKPGRGNFPKTGHGAPLNMINEGPGDDTKNKKKPVEEKITKQVVEEINKRFPDRPQPEGVELGKFSKFVKRGENIIEKEGLKASYKPAKGISKEQFENYANAIKKSNPEAAKKAIFKYMQ